MKNSIHKTAIIDNKAKLGNSITIGPYSTIGPNVHIKNRVQIHSNVNIQGYTVINEDTEIFPFASIGTIPQDLKYHGEKSKLIIGKKTEGEFFEFKEIGGETQNLKIEEISSLINKAKSN